MFGIISEEMFERYNMFIGSMSYEEYRAYYKRYRLNPNKNLWIIGRKYYLESKPRVNDDMLEEEKLRILRGRETLGKMSMEEASAHYAELGLAFDEEYWTECHREYLEEHPMKAKK